MKFSGFNIELLKRYFSFLFQNNLDEVVTFFHLINLESLPSYLSLSNNEQINLIDNEINKFLKSFTNDIIIEYFKSWSTDLIKTNVTLSPYEKNDISFFSQLLINRKSCLIQFIPEFTMDSKETLSIINEIEYACTLQESELSKAQLGHQQKEIKKQSKKAKEVDDSPDKIRKILDHTPIHINLIDLEKDRSIFNNGAGQMLFGHTPKQVMSQSFTKLWLSKVHPKDKENVKARIKNFNNLKEEDIDQLEYRMIDKNGKIVWYYSRATVFKRKNGKVKQVLLNGLNITGLKKAEEKKRYVESQLKEAQKIAHIGSYDYDIVNDVLKYTEEAYRIYEFPKEKKEFKVSDYKEILTTKSVKKFEKNMNDALKDKVNFLYEGQYRIVMPDKRKKDIISRGKITRDKNGKPLRMLGTVMDITSIKKAEYQLKNKNKEINKINKKLEDSQKEIQQINSQLERKISERSRELKGSEEQYRFLAENVPQLFWTTGPDGGIDFINKNVTKYTGAKPELIYEWNWQNYIHPDDLPNVMKGWKESIKNGTTYLKEFRIKRKDKVYRWHLVKTVPLKDKNGMVIKWMGSGTDIDEQKEYSEELKNKNKQLTKINKDLDNFIYTASHDLRAPISNIEGLLNSLDDEIKENKNVDGDVPIILDMMDTSVKKFKKTIVDLTEITKAQKSGTEFTKNNNLREVLEEVYSMVSDLIATSKAKISTDFKEVDSINFPRKNLRSILYNLISNAIKFRSPKRRPEIFITTENVEDFTLLSVKDNGQGFDPNQKSKIFGMFKRLQSEEEGSGIGLYLVKRIITNAGGKIDAKSEKGDGSTFKVYFLNKKV